MSDSVETREAEPLAELEALIFAARGPATVGQIRRALPRLSPGRIGELVGRINQSLRSEGHPYEIAQVAGGYQFRTRAEFSRVIRNAQPDRTVRMSRAALETLSVVAYKQPVTRAEVEDVRCVDCGAVLRSLLDRGLLRIVGRKDAPGRPAIYGTSPHFLEVFGLNSLRDLPALGELRDSELQPSDPESAGDEAEGMQSDHEPSIDSVDGTDEPEPRVDADGSLPGPAEPT
jgi:segregation and condensation protein B